MRGAWPILLALGAAGCGNEFDDDFHLVAGLRLLAVRGEPAEVAPGERVTLTALAVDPAGGAISVRWTACTLAPIPGTAINDRCLDEAGGHLMPLGEGAAIEAVVPDLRLESLGPPDATGGRYLPVRLRVSTATEAQDGIFRIRIADGASQNRNPKLDGVSLAGAAMTALAEGVALDAHAGEKVVLRGRFGDGSDESYSVAQPDGSRRMATETLTITWFASAGTLEHGRAGPAVDEVLTVDKHLPAIGSTIDLWLVGRDERGGIDWLHRTLRLR
ncbi:MAG: hypothetical protein EXR72_21800 [Myxococcales bacterium]|nr:hypothetical protein [Myxococcales bacterium]